MIPSWTSRKEGGCFVITASAAGLLTQIGSLEYAVTKSSAVSVAEFLAITYGLSGVRVTVICPQAVNTPMVSGPNVVAAVDGMLEPDDVACETILAIQQGKFLVAMPGVVTTYIQRKTSDYDRWIKGMQRLNSKFINSSL